MRDIVIIAHDIRSTHNVGALLRTAECLGVQKVYLTGYTPYPVQPDDDRLPHVAQKLTSQIHKTALGAEQLVTWEHQAEVVDTLDRLQKEGYAIVALEQTADSFALPAWVPPQKIALLLGREVEGIEQQLLKRCSFTVEIPQQGQKESLNVVQAAAIALYHVRFAPFSM
ncbi:MAG: TrmH family RNA methyltransferase [Candidatus Saccharimonadales bacterium]